MQDDFPFPNEVFDYLGVRRVARDPIPYVENNMPDVLAAGLFECGVELRPQLRTFRALLEWLNLGDTKDNALGVELLVMLCALSDTPSSCFR